MLHLSIRRILFPAVVGAMITAALAAEYHVSASGDDAAGGGPEHPWRTLGHAAAAVVAGDTIRVHAGTYNEFLSPAVSGEAGRMIVFRAMPGEAVVIDGTGLPVAGLTGLVDLSSRSYIRIEGFTIRNLQTSMSGQVPVGILVQGASAGVEIVGNSVERIRSTTPVDQNLLGRDAHGIAVYGNAAQPVADILIRGNTLSNLTLGSSEAMVLNGNVTGFRVLENIVHDCDNIGIDAIGFEATAPPPATDQARAGVIAGNLVYNCTSVGNPAYGTDSSAGGIYIDGGRDIVVERNHVHHCDIGIEVASEHKGKTSTACTIRSNILRSNLMAGLFVGGYNSNTTGNVDGCAILNNTFYNNDTDVTGDEYGQIHIQYRVTNTVFSNNILYHDIAKGAQFNLFIVHWNTTGSGNTFNHNLHYGPGIPVWVMKNKWREGWTAYANDAASGASEQWGNPLFADTALQDFTPGAASPAIDCGDGARSSQELRDIRGRLRWEGSAPDLGAIERDAALPPQGELTLAMQSQDVTLTWTRPNGGFHDVQVSTDLVRWQTLPGYDSAAGDSLSAQALMGIADRPRLFFRSTSR